MLSTLLILFAIIDDLQAFKPGNVRMHMSTRTICNPDVKDVHNNPAPCGKSMAMETYGLTLPGMEDGSVTIREDMIVAKDGLIRVKAMPSRPYQFLMTVESPETKRIDQLYKNQAITISETKQEPESVRLLGAAKAPGSLQEDGWTSEGTTTLNGATVHKYIKWGPQGVDATSKANYSALYQTGMYPDHWIFYTDSNDEKPVKLLGINSIRGKTLQETDYSNHEELDDAIDIAEAEKEMHTTYQITSSRRLGENDVDAPPVNLDYINATFIAEDERTFFEDAEEVDWLGPQRLRTGLSGAFGARAGVMYFGIPKGSAADTFFHTEYNRRMVQLVKFEFPTSCRNDEGKQVQRYCLFVSVDATMEKFSLNAGMTFVDVKDDKKSASLKVIIEIGKSDGAPVLNLSVKAEGCAIVWQWGEGVSLNIVVCISGSASGKDLLQPDKRTFKAEIEIKVTFNLNLPVVGSIIHWSIWAKLGCTAKPNNVITAYGEIGTGISLLLAGAGVSVDIKGNTMDNVPNKWQFFSGVNLNAWVNVVVYKHDWNWRWEIWHASPVYF
ncbi:hypothetical protein Pmar_PMAR007059 [Perkinsus marinus ATCC 50983]|uniref:Uncharacterized protein n=1 Tax=Perkinsus marinus (strain ATCC 50983 / TXsc) TaxID=423536 RepID=C5KZN4_PERM5|nr:hypothetical protein Pmar_PMAR007059 [Perkinsus marinus ATCC 50983]EER10062.1 hypothetical protein Pmar_PMAR007059 [Perkinsus marinus ATCC 50983]|eukprot:XP_002778267.1 hypothetical protein Pmar_PMAR007059 [Perkinsus marinus ATCC 50983]